MMLVVVVAVVVVVVVVAAAAGSLLVAMVTCTLFGFYEMGKREKEIAFVEGLADLPTVTVATKSGTKYHSKTCQHLLTAVIAGPPGIKDFTPCQDCFPEWYTYQEKKRRFVWCYGTVAGFILLTGFSLGCLATLCGMMIGPGTYQFSVRDPWQALGYNVDRNMVKDELALGDVRAPKDERRGRRESQRRLERKGIVEADESVDDDMDESAYKTQYARREKRKSKELHRGHREL